MKLRLACPEDEESIWEMFADVIRGGDSYVCDENTTREEALDYWMGTQVQCFVAEIDGVIVGAHLLRPNRPGRGSHIANASFMVHKSARGKGVGVLLGQHAIDEAIRQGYRGIQFNFVVSTNTAAVALWTKLGFRIIGTTPGGYNHATLGYVDVYTMYLSLL